MSQFGQKRSLDSGNSNCFLEPLPNLAIRRLSYGIHSHELADASPLQRGVYRPISL